MARTPAIVLRFMLAALCCAGAACGPRLLERHEYSRALMGTEARVVIYADSESDARRGAEAAFHRIATLEHVMSDWRDDSEVAALSRAAGGPSQTISLDLYRVLEPALRIAQASGGAFDPTVGPVVKLWREARKKGEIPDRAALAAAVRLVDWHDVEIAAGPPPLARLGKAGMQLDLGGIGKGFAAQDAYLVLSGMGLDRSLVSIAGDVFCGQSPPGRDGWEVAIGESGENLTVTQAAVSTSGDAEQFTLKDGVRYSHIVDPKTGMGLTGSSWVTVSGPDGAIADALATAVSVLGEDRGRTVVSRFPGARIVRFRRP